MSAAEVEAASAEVPASSSASDDEGNLGDDNPPPPLPQLGDRVSVHIDKLSHGLPELYFKATEDDENNETPLTWAHLVRGEPCPKKALAVIGEQQRSRILVLYTGGTIGMTDSGKGLKNENDFMEGYLETNPTFHDPNVRVCFADLEDRPRARDNPGAAGKAKVPAEKVTRKFLTTPVLQFGHRACYHVLEYPTLLDSVEHLSATIWVKPLSANDFLLVLPVRGSPPAPPPATEENVVCVRLYPGITASVMRNMLRPPVVGAVLQTYGAGNAPNDDEALIAEISKAIRRGVVIINCSQCLRGSVQPDYATGVALQDAGVIFGSDMTVEAALTKLAFVLAHEHLSRTQISELFRVALSGEHSSQDGAIPGAIDYNVLFRAPVAQEKTEDEEKQAETQAFKECVEDMCMDLAAESELLQKLPVPEEADLPPQFKHVRNSLVEAQQKFQAAKDAFLEAQQKFKIVKEALSQTKEELLAQSHGSKGQDQPDDTHPDSSEKDPKGENNLSQALNDAMDAALEQLPEALWQQVKSTGEVEHLDWMVGNCGVGVLLSGGRTLLHEAVEAGNLAFVERLVITHLANVLAKDANDKTPLDLAIDQKHKPIARVLLRHGRLEGELPKLSEHPWLLPALWHQLTSTGELRHLDFIVKHFGVDTPLSGQRTMLHNAVLANNVAFVKKLVEVHTANVLARDEKNRTPLQFAVSRKAGPIVHILLRYGKTGDPKVSISDQGITCCLHEAARKGLAWLLAEFDVAYLEGFRDDARNTVLHVAAEHNQKEVVKRLLQLGFNARLQNGNRKTPTSQDEEIRKLLEDARTPQSPR